MHAAFSRDGPGGFAAVGDGWTRHIPAASQPASVGIDTAPSRYGERRLRPATIGGIVAVHALLLGALVRLDVIPLSAPPAKPLVVELLPLTPPPPERVLTVKPVPVPVPVVAPVPLVRTETPPPPVAVVAVAPPVAVPLVATAAPAPAAPAAPNDGPVDHPDVLAQTLTRAELRYPLESRRNKEQGTVVLSVLVTKDGGVADIRVKSSSGFDRLDDAALASVRRWRFRAAQKDGQPVLAWGFVSIPFVLQKT